MFTQYLKGMIYVICLAISGVISAQEYIPLLSLNSNSIADLTKYGKKYKPVEFTSENSIWLATGEEIYQIKRSGQVISSITFEQKKVGSQYNLSITDSLLISSGLDLATGRRGFVIYNLNIHKFRFIEHHGNASITSILGDKEQEQILLGGLHFTNYSKWLDKYDTNNPADRVLVSRKFKQFYNTQTPYTLSKYNFQGALMDSCNFIGRSGEDLAAFVDLARRGVKDHFDVDNSGNIYTSNISEGFSIRVFSPEFKFLREFQIDSVFKPIPKNLTNFKARKIHQMRNTFTVISHLHVVDNYIYVSYTTNSGDWDLYTLPYTYRIFTTRGELLTEGVLTHDIVATNNNHAYFLVSKTKRYFWQKPKPYLVQFKFVELLNNQFQQSNLLKRLGLF